MVFYNIQKELEILLQSKVNTIKKELILLIKNN
jgi:hypothetical protein